MTNKIKVADLPEFDMAQYLGTDEEVAEYLRQVLEDGEPGELAAALGHIAKARGMTEIAKASGIKREALYKALRPNAQPRLDTVQRVCKALGVTLTAKVTDPRETAPSRGCGLRQS
jgi:probable addiction module antidote protein